VTPDHGPLLKQAYTELDTGTFSKNEKERAEQRVVLANHTRFQFGTRGEFAIFKSPQNTPDHTKKFPGTANA
jgi:hypothetical protein